MLPFGKLLLSPPPLPPAATRTMNRHAAGWLRFLLSNWSVVVQRVCSVRSAAEVARGQFWHC